MYYNPDDLTYDKITSYFMPRPRLISQVMPPINYDVFHESPADNTISKVVDDIIKDYEKQLEEWVERNPPNGRHLRTETFYHEKPDGTPFIEVCSWYEEDEIS